MSRLKLWMANKILNNKKIKNMALEKSVIYNLNWNPLICQKRILIIYKFPYFYFKSENLSHTIPLESGVILQYFINKNYVIDVVDVSNLAEDFKSFDFGCYDVIMGFGSIFNKAANFNQHAQKIIYITEAHPDFSYKREKERIDYYYKRHKIKVPIMRSGRFYKKEDLDKATHAIVLGEIEQFYDMNIPLYKIFPTGLKNRQHSYSVREVIRTKNNFLWFGSSGAVHKGLDILFDIFEKNSNIHLYVCGFNAYERKFLKFPEKNNITDCGFVDIQSQKFIDLVNQCSFAILPSCSEAASTSVNTCMRHGMIPIVTSHIGFDKLEEYVEIVDGYQEEMWTDMIKKMLATPDHILLEKHKMIYEFANNFFNIERFSNEINIILDEIVSKE